MYLRLTIDPAGAKPHAWALWCCDELQAIGSGLPPCEAHEVWIERPWKGPRLWLSAGHLVGRMGLQIDEVYWTMPSVWKRALCGKSSGKTARQRLDTYPVHASVLADLCEGEARIYREAIESAKDPLDVADAVGIGVYVRRVPPDKVKTRGL